MASMKDIKQRIGNVKSTAQIIKAMDTIASTKLHKIRAQLEGVRPIYRDIRRQAQELGQNPEAGKNAFYAGREVKHSLYIVLTSDRALRERITPMCSPPPCTIWRGRTKKSSP